MYVRKTESRRIFDQDILVAWCEPVAAEGYLKKSKISQQYPSGDGRA
jgi:hypothetical protein